MNKLLLSSVSVMAFVTAATNATELTTSTDTAKLKDVAKAELDMVVSLPAINMNDSVKAQTLVTLNEESQRLLGKGLYVMNEERNTRQTARSE
ncbi:hypothetical protein [Alteromonas halophila]|uniref:Uncharacterized protein n=1 Tax=Alteromonas halophila TaxID=516698 RepID=A0A918MVT0_9ALTE|nr:hypothetical protein [Alteromonas halophila]GGW76022.1 hypothetical protein GCM10007391_05570 [Alteromonas halophila]